MKLCRYIRLIILYSPVKNTVRYTVQLRQQYNRKKSVQLSSTEMHFTGSRFFFLLLEKPSIQCCYKEMTNLVTDSSTCHLVDRRRVIAVNRCQLSVSELLEVLHLLFKLLCFLFVLVTEIL